MSDRVKPPLAKRLASGYHHVRWGPNQWIQWPVGRPPRAEDGFGMLSPEHFAVAARVTGEDPTEGENGHE